MLSNHLILCRPLTYNWFNRSWYSTPAVGGDSRKDSGSSLSCIYILSRSKERVYSYWESDWKPVHWAACDPTLLASVDGRAGPLDDASLRLLWMDSCHHFTEEQKDTPIQIKCRVMRALAPVSSQNYSSPVHRVTYLELFSCSWNSFPSWFQLAREMQRLRARCFRNCHEGLRIMLTSCVSWQTFFSLVSPMLGGCPGLWGSEGFLAP